MRLTLADGPVLVADFSTPRRVLSSAVLGGGIGEARGWLNATVARDYARLDPAEDLAERAAALGLAGPIVGMLTAVDVRRREQATRGCASAVATVGVGHALAAAGSRPRVVEPAGTINLLVVVDAALDDAALAGAAQTAIEAKAQALAAAGVPAANAPGAATGTATDAFCIAALPGGGVPFAGPATPVGADIGLAVYGAVLAGALADRAAREDAPAAERGPMAGRAPTAPANGSGTVAGRAQARPADEREPMAANGRGVATGRARASRANEGAR